MGRDGIYGEGIDFRQTSPTSWGFKSEDPRKWSARCDICPLNGQTPVWGDGPRDAQLAYIGEAPGRDEVSVGIPFVGKSGEIFEGWLKKHGLNRREVWVSNAVQCFPPGGDLKLHLQAARKQHRTSQKGVPTKEQKPFISPVDACRGRLMAELRIPRCENCSTAEHPKYLRGPNKHLCTCKTPRILPVYKQMTKDGFIPARTWHPMGNFAMQALLGFDGITAHHAYVENLKERRERMMGIVPKWSYSTPVTTKAPSGKGSMPPRGENKR